MWMGVVVHDMIQWGWTSGKLEIIEAFIYIYVGYNVLINVYIIINTIVLILFLITQKHVIMTVIIINAMIGHAAIYMVVSNIIGG